MDLLESLKAFRKREPLVSPIPPEERIKALVASGKLISPVKAHYPGMKITYIPSGKPKLTNQNWIPKTPYDEEIEAIFGKRAGEAKQILKYKKAGGEFGGENQQFVIGREGDWTNPETGITDRGLFRIASSTFDDFVKRKGGLLKKHGINSYDDLFEPNKNIRMAKIIFEEQGWRAWVARPSWLG